MSALDYTLQNSVGKGVSVSKAEFRRGLRKKHDNVDRFSDHQVDLLFGVFDKNEGWSLDARGVQPGKSSPTRSGKGMATSRGAPEK